MRLVDRLHVPGRADGRDGAAEQFLGGPAGDLLRLAVPPHEPPLEVEGEDDRGDRLQELLLVAQDRVPCVLVTDVPADHLTLEHERGDCARLVAHRPHDHVEHQARADPGGGRIVCLELEPDRDAACGPVDGLAEPSAGLGPIVPPGGLPEELADDVLAACPGYVEERLVDLEHDPRRRRPAPRAAPTGRRWPGTAVRHRGARRRPTPARPPLPRQRRRTEDYSTAMQGSNWKAVPSGPAPVAAM